MMAHARLALLVLMAIAQAAAQGPQCTPELCGSFLAAQTVGLPGSEIRADFFVAEDLDGDGHRELVGMHSGTRQVSIVRGLLGKATRFESSKGATVSTVVLTGTGKPTGVAVADVNGDGMPDIVVAHRSGVVALENGGRQAFAQKPLLTFAVKCVGSIAAPSIGVGDALLFGTEQGLLMRTQDSNGFASHHFVSREIASVLTVADVDGDGTADLLFVSGSYVFCYRGDPAASSPATQFPTLLFQEKVRSASSIDVGDIDQDGDMDVIVASTLPHVVVCFTMEGGQRQARRTLLGSLGLVRDARMADLNGDGLTDVVTLTKPDGAITAWVQQASSGPPSFVAEPLLPPNPLITALLLTDLDGDSDQDVGVGFGSGGDAAVMWGGCCVADFPLIEGTPPTTASTTGSTTQTSTRSTTATSTASTTQSSTGTTTGSTTGTTSPSTTHSTTPSTTASTSPSTTATTTATTTPEPVFDTAVLRVNVAGQEYIDSHGQRWSADAFFRLGGEIASSPEAPIEGTDDPDLFRTARLGDAKKDKIRYKLKVTPDQPHRVRLHFAEIDAGSSSAGDRTFNVFINDVRVAKKFDIVAESGFETAMSKDFVVTATSGGSIDVRLKGKKGLPELSAIEVFAEGIATTTPSTTGSTSPATTDSTTGSTTPATTVTTTPATTATTTPSTVGPITGFDLPVLRINAGGPAIVDASGQAWEAGEPFANAGGASESLPDSTPIADSDTPSLFRTAAVDVLGDDKDLKLKLTAPRKGSYRLVLHFAESDPGSATVGARVFNVEANGERLLTKLDVFAEAGFLTPLRKEAVVEVKSDLELVVTLEDKNTGVARINAVEVYAEGRATSTMSTTATTTGAVTTGTTTGASTGSTTGTTSPATTDSTTGSTTPATTPTTTLASRTLLRLNAGASETYVDTLGQEWAPDAGFTNSTMTFAVAAEILGTPEQGLFTTERWSADDLVYTIPLGGSPVRVEVLLHFADICTCSRRPGQRVFDILLESRLVRSGYEILAEVGWRTADTLVFVVDTDGDLDVALRQVIGQPKLSALEVRLPADPTASTSTMRTPTPTSGAGSTGPSAATTTTGSAAAGSTTDSTTGSTTPATTVTTTPSTVGPITGFDLPVLRINAGGPAIVDASGQAWEAGEPFANAGGASESLPDSTPIADSDTPSLFRTAAVDVLGDDKDLKLKLTAPRKGSYRLVLHFAESDPGSATVGARVFNVEANGERLLTKLDVFAEAGFLTPLRKEAVVEVKSDLELVVTLEDKNTGVARINAVEVYAEGRATSTMSTTATTTGAVTTGTTTGASTGSTTPTMPTTAAAASTVTSTRSATPATTPTTTQSTTTTGAAASTTPPSPASSRTTPTTTTTAATTGTTKPTTTATTTTAKTTATTTASPSTSMSTSATTTAATTADLAGLGLDLPVLRVNVGGPKYTDSQRRKWKAGDAFVNNGGAMETIPDTVAIQGTADAPLYRTADVDVVGDDKDLKYRLEVPKKGLYRLVLHFAETELAAASPGKREFTIEANGERLFARLDIAREAGFATALLKQGLVDVDSSKEIVLTLVDKKVGLARLNAIEVFREGARTTTATSTPTTAPVPPTTPSTTATTGPSTSSSSSAATNATAGSTTGAGATASTSAPSTAPVLIDTSGRLPAPVYDAKYPQAVVRINAGSSTPYTDSNGNLWEADTFFKSGVAQEAGPEVVINGTDDQPIYRTETVQDTNSILFANNLIYKVDVPKGNLLLVLHFADWCDCTRVAGAREFSIEVNGERLVRKLDLVAEAGWRTAHAVQLEVKVDSDKQIKLEFFAKLLLPTLAGIEVFEKAP